MLNDGRVCAAMDALTGLAYQYLSQKFRWLAATYTSSNRGAKVNIENIETGGGGRLSPTRTRLCVTCGYCRRLLSLPLRI
jgi:hypothetical protein